jgi:hypothetical protein
METHDCEEWRECLVLVGEGGDVLQYFDNLWFEIFFK